MLPIIFIAIISLLTLVVLHELGHFFVAKKFNVKIEEFGVGLPPRIWAKRFGETLYSLNLLPLGAFVRLLGEEELTPGPRSFSQKPIWQRALIVAGGVVSFWIMAAIILSFVMGIGVPAAITDADTGFKNPQVQIVVVTQGSPAKEAGLKAGDIIKEFSISNYQFSIEKVAQVQEFTDQYKGQEVVLTVQRGQEVFDVALVPRVGPPAGEGPIGISLARVALKSYPWWQAPLKGIEETLRLTGSVIGALVGVLWSLIRGTGLPEGAELMGPVGIGSWLVQAAQLGLSYYLRFIALIAIYLAIFNALPIPAVDGGKLFFLGIEAVRGKPIPQNIEKGLTAVFFLFLVGLMIFVTFKDIARLVM